MRLRRSRLTHRQTERLLEHFVAGTPARAAAQLVGVNRNTARLFYHHLREIIAQRLGREHGQTGEVEMDWAGFKGPHGFPVFALLRRAGRIHIVMPADAHGKPPPPASATKVRPDAIVCADTPDQLAPRRRPDARHDLRVVRRVPHVVDRQRVPQLHQLVHCRRLLRFRRGPRELRHHDRRTGAD